MIKFSRASFLIEILFFSSSVISQKVLFVHKGSKAFDHQNLSHLGSNGIVHFNSQYQVVKFFQSNIETQVMALAFLFSTDCIILNKAISQGHSSRYFTNGHGNQFSQSRYNQVSSTITGFHKISYISLAFCSTISIIFID